MKQDRIVVENLSKLYRSGSAKGQKAWGRRFAQIFGRHGKKAASDEIWALRNVSFRVPPGETIGVIGPNGAGKTTLLKILSRITLPTSGRAVVRGRVVSLLEMGAGFYPHLSGRENVFLNAALYGIPKSEVTARLPDIVKFAELEDFIDLALKHYSSGMHLRLAFSVASNLNPEVLLADEVLAVGDLRFQERCIRRVEETRRTGTTTLLVSHDLATVSRLCTRAIWLDHGQIVRAGPTEEVVREYQHSVLNVDASSEVDTQSGIQQNKWVELLDVVLLSEKGTPIGAVRQAEDSIIRFTVRPRQEGVRFHCSVELFSKGLLVFRSIQPEAYEAPDTRPARIDVRIPGNLLAATNYVVNAYVHNVLVGGKARNKPVTAQNALSFRVFESPGDSHLDQYLIGREDGMIRPHLQWNIRKAG